MTDQAEEPLDLDFETLKMIFEDKNMQGDPRRPSELASIYVLHRYQEKFGLECSLEETTGLGIDSFRRGKRILVDAGIIPKEDQFSCLPENKRNGFVYLMGDGYGELFKIGFAKNVSKRLKEMRTGNPKVHLVFKSSGKMSDEKFLHKKFSGKRFSDDGNGSEWFCLSEEDINYIKSENWKGVEK